ncbi:MAG: ATP synthase F1 subunit delta [Verrucomicrobiota bacterium]
MKINREARNTAKSFFMQCFVRGKLDPMRVKKFVRLMITKKPRNYLGILERFRKLVEIEETHNFAVVESARAITTNKAAIQRQLKDKFGSNLNIHFVVNSELIGGTRIQVGSNVWDGSIRGRLDAIERGIS